MRLDLLRILRCPECKGTLSLGATTSWLREVFTGSLTCGCGQRYPIERGVPRMLPGAERKLEIAEKFSFSHQWAMYRYGDLSWELRLDERVAYFCHYIDTPSSSVAGLRVLDAGCGNGTLSAAIASLGASVVAIDYSSSVERAEANKRQFAGISADNVQYVQADVSRPPFAGAVFDVVYADGVLHHTKNTKASFETLAALVKPEGRFFVWLYRKDLTPFGWVKERLVDLGRWLIRPFGMRTKRLFCLAGAVVLNCELRVMRGLRLATRRMVPVWLKAVNLFDTFTPVYNHRHLPAEIRGWFVEEGFCDIADRTVDRLGPGGVGILGVRGSLRRAMPDGSTVEACIEMIREPSIASDLTGTVRVDEESARWQPPRSMERSP